MIFDVKARDEKMAKYLIDVLDNVKKSEVEGFILLLKLESETYRKYIFPGRINSYEWVGGIESLKLEFMLDTRGNK
jgi:hypothetical protein